ncbi:cysteine-rich receptor-like protein kinase 2 isoform X2 [Neltuma alba]|uniref:cysteine-rich receptor-like protein kinase 2 isoform X2 n=1 Tax=Neltuma alba TaxID=207710 RepID=UPI0010A400D8|nr:cysteine-rich receptor-like protein kinase 2 isoform X2 [Prosopis alba]
MKLSFLLLRRFQTPINTLISFALLTSFSSSSYSSFFFQNMFQPHVLPLIAFVFWSWRILDGVVSDPQINFLTRGCNPYNEYLVANVSLFEANINATLRDIREQISGQNKHFATAQQAASGGNTVSSLFQCRSYLSMPDCIACFDVAAPQILSCAAGEPGGRVVYDGCYLRYDISVAFFGATTQSINSASCGNQTITEEPAISFTSAVQQILMNLQTATPRITGFSVATKAQVPTNGPTIYAFAQCTETITQSECQNCLNVLYNNMQSCLPNSEGSSNNKGAIIGGVVGSVVVLALIFVALYVWVGRLKRPTRRVPGGDVIGATKLKGPAIYNYNDLKTATKNFSEENKLGQGGFGVVYKGTLKNGKEIAIKKLTFRHFTRMEEEFENEVKLISNVHHRNLVRLLGYCIYGKTRILVYEYMKNSSLDIFLFGNLLSINRSYVLFFVKLVALSTYHHLLQLTNLFTWHNFIRLSKMQGSLNWKQRHDIILGTARGLAYLHEEFYVCIIHRDVKPNNILLDEDLQPKIADFGLARLLPEDKTHLSTNFAGTLGYSAPEYVIHGQLSEKVDVYSYGVAILEIISGQKNKKLGVDGDIEGEFLLRKAWKLYEEGTHAELVDDTLDPNDYDVEEVKKVIEVGLLCIQASAEMRPTMSEIVALLQTKDLLENMKPTMPILIETN